MSNWHEVNLLCEEILEDYVPNEGTEIGRYWGLVCELHEAIGGGIDYEDGFQDALEKHIQKIYKDLKENWTFKEVEREIPTRRIKEIKLTWNG